MGMDLIDTGVYLPPFPTIHPPFLMQQSKLASFAESVHLQRASAAEEAAAKRMEQEAKADVAIPEMPPIPADWKPGDPIPGLDLPGLLPAQPPAQEKPDTTTDKEPIVAPVLDLDAGIDDDFVLNAEAVSDTDSDSGMSDEDMDDDDQVWEHVTSLRPGACIRQQVHVVGECTLSTG
eukprot:TRINITY_DN6045_c0_g1_i13.p2 TRINITY_DN6045_c0_g1~~TRINITY_DN6045_c0_g1_i13.p2  ORF type:complete len:177 (-),score=29.48 TRINITY_DN6045_c0_g1_i13:215-745(-)